MRDPQAESQRWFDQAEYDLKVARWNDQGQLYSAACFWCQQTGEKALKAYLLSRGQRHVYGHSVADLCQRCAEVDPAFQPLCQAGVILDRYYIPTRYPDALPGGIPGRSFLPSDSREALALADQFVERVATELGVPRTEPAASPAESESARVSEDQVQRDADAATTTLEAEGPNAVSAAPPPVAR